MNLANTAYVGIYRESSANTFVIAKQEESLVLMLSADKQIILSPSSIDHTFNNLEFNVSIIFHVNAKEPHSLSITIGENQFLAKREFTDFSETKRIKSEFKNLFIGILSIIIFLALVFSAGPSITKKLCDHEILSACTLSTYLHFLRGDKKESKVAASKKVQLRQEKIISSLKKECNNSNSDSCLDLAKHYKKIGFLDKVTEIQSSLCYEQKNEDACLDLVETLKSSKKNDQANKLIKDSCEVNNMPKLCIAYASSINDEVKKIAILGKACTAGAIRACRTTGEYYLHNQNNLPKAKRFLKLACERKDKVSCNQEKMIETINKGLVGCKNKNAILCMEAANTLKRISDLAHAKKIKEKACTIDKNLYECAK